MVIGLDTGEVPARWICAEPDEARPYVLDHRSFKTLRAFKRHWRRCCQNRPVQVAAATQTPDPLGILPWLESKGVPVQRYPWGAYPVHLNGDFSMWEMPKCYERPYALALYASSRQHAAGVTRLLGSTSSRPRRCSPRSGTNRSA
jgi:hypothetical protein